MYFILYIYMCVGMWMCSFVSVLFVCECVYFRVYVYAYHNQLRPLHLNSHYLHHTPTQPSDTSHPDMWTGFWCSWLQREVQTFQWTGLLSILSFLSPFLSVLSILESLYTSALVWLYLTVLSTFSVNMSVSFVMSVLSSSSNTHPHRCSDGADTQACTQAMSPNRQTDTLAKKLLKKLHKERATDKHEGRYSSRQDGRQSLWLLLYSQT